VTNQRASLYLAAVAFLLFAFSGEGGVLTPAGPRQIVVLHETAEVTPAQSQMFVALRSGANADYLASKGHKLLILDDDAKGVDGNPAPLVAKLNAESVPPPSLFVLSGERVVFKGALPATAEDVLNVVKGAGG
jgi:hypothetical protein